MLNDQYSKRQLVTTLCILVPVLLFFALSNFGKRLAAGASSPFSGILQTVCRNASNAWNAIRGEEEETLKADRILLEELLANKRSTEDILAENKQLRSMLNLPVPAGWKPVYAELSMRDPAAWTREFRISRGENDGVKVGNPVLMGHVLVGRVVETFNETARVATIASPECRLSVFIQNTAGVSYPGVFSGFSGMASGSRLECRIDFLPKDAQLQAGDLVITSGIGGQIPYGIPVGNLEMDAMGRCPVIIDNARATSLVTPYADVNNVKTVVVFTRKDN